MKNYFKKLPFSQPINEYLLSIPLASFIADDPSFDFRGRCRTYLLIKLIEGKK